MKEGGSRSSPYCESAAVQGVGSGEVRSFWCFSLFLLAGLMRALGPVPFVSVFFFVVRMQRRGSCELADWIWVLFVLC